MAKILPVMRASSVKKKMREIKWDFLLEALQCFLSHGSPCIKVKWLTSIERLGQLQH